MDAAPTSESVHIPEPDHVPPEAAGTTAPTTATATSPAPPVSAPSSAVATSPTPPVSAPSSAAATSPTLPVAISPTLPSATSPTLPAATSPTLPVSTSPTLPVSAPSSTPEPVVTEVASVSQDVVPLKPIIDALSTDMLQMVIKRCRETNKPNFWTAQFLGVSIDFVLGRHGLEEERRLVRKKAEDAERNVEEATKNPAIFSNDKHELVDPLANDTESGKQYPEMSREDLYRQVARVLCGRIRNSAEEMPWEEFAKRLQHIKTECSGGRPPFSGMYKILLLTTEECEVLCKKYAAVFEARWPNQGGRYAQISPPKRQQSVVQPAQSRATMPVAAVATLPKREPKVEECRPLVKTKTEVPKAKTELPVAKTELPVAKTDLPVAKTELPVAKPDVPTRKPGTPVTKLDILIAEPSVTVKATGKQRSPPADGDDQPQKKRKMANPRSTYPMHTRIKLKDNPKSKGSRAYERYASYEKATTVQEYFDLGGGGDFKHDLAKGFITILDS
eukprot:GEMP01043361.1.p1 GENE.GEMP01043361.1~~GEMP01043361.1.p1  ORF type:complete len:517 (+),score=91.55 GEMP01043361.1:42-1553(+)